jgi:hypothetical protein
LVTIAGLALLAAEKVNWGDDHALFKCSSTKADCFSSSATKITVYGPLQADAGDDASDGSVVISINGGGTKSNVDTTFRYGVPLITSLTWS